MSSPGGHGDLRPRAAFSGEDKVSHGVESTVLISLGVLVSVHLKKMSIQDVLLCLVKHSNNHCGWTIDLTATHQDTKKHCIRILYIFTSKF